ncbi:MAG: 2-dehydropantoate 2-reductase N-terminal domain-containing protein [Mobilitalea sp.]
MKILVYGAGVIGCELAHMLRKGQNDVTLLARGEWKHTIENNGLIIRHYVQLQTTTDQIKTIDVLETDYIYDLIFVAMQYKQLPEVLPVLAANKSRYIVLVGNNMNAEGCQKQIIENSLVKKEIAFAFQGTGGRRENNRIISIHARVGMTIGGVKSILSPDFRMQLTKAFSNTGYRLTDECNMDAWLQCHVAFILPICYVCYMLNGHLERAGKTQINQIIEATIEAHVMLKALGYPIRPVGEEEFFTSSRRKCYWMLRIMSKTPIGRLAASDHAMHAVNEMHSLDEAFESLRQQTDVPMPTWSTLRESMVKY